MNPQIEEINNLNPMDYWESIQELTPELMKLWEASEGFIDSMGSGASAQEAAYIRFVGALVDLNTRSHQVAL